jgi:hypothetical protein
MTSNDNLTLSWKSNPVHDMIADSVVALILSIEANPGSAKCRKPAYPFVATATLTMDMFDGIVIGVAHGHSHGDDGGHTHSHGERDTIAAQLAKEANYVLDSKLPPSSGSSSSSSYQDDETAELMTFLEHQYGPAERLPDGKLRLPHEKAILDPATNVYLTSFPLRVVTITSHTNHSDMMHNN